MLKTLLCAIAIAIAIAIALPWPTMAQDVKPAQTIALISTTRASPSVKPNESLMARSAGHFFICIPFKTCSRGDGGRWQEQQGADWPNYKRSFVWHSMPRTLMKDARGGPIR